MMKCRWKSLILGLILLISMLTLSVLGAEDPPNLRRMEYTNRSKDEAVEWQKTLRPELFRILKLSDLVQSKDNIPLNAKERSRTDNGDFSVSEIEIDSTPGRKITVTLTVPSKGDGPFPAVVCIHGHGGTQKSVYDEKSIYHGFARELASKGYVTVAADVGQHEVFEANRILMGERLWDVIRCVDLLCAQPNVDRNRIGCGGLSLGGEMAMWLGAMDTRIAATVSCGFLTVMDQMEQNHCLCWKFDGLRELVDYADIYSLTAPRELQCQNGIEEGPNDFCIELAAKAIKETRRIYHDYGSQPSPVLHIHPGGHEVDVTALVNFFNQHLIP